MSLPSSNAYGLAPLLLDKICSTPWPVAHEISVLSESAVRRSTEAPTQRWGGGQGRGRQRADETFEQHLAVSGVADVGGVDGEGRGRF